MASNEKEHSYVHGHHPSVLTSHTWRTLQNSAAYLIPYLDEYKANPTSEHPTLLDAGCGPGTITCDLAEYLPTFKVTAIDSVLLDSCTTLAEEKGLKNVTFQQADIFKLPFKSDTFDIIHAHQVLQHLPTPPIAAIRELIRVCKPGGIIAARDCDIESFVCHPRVPAVEKWKEVYISVSREVGGDPLAGRKLQKWFMLSGVSRSNINCSSSTWTYSTPEERKWWGEMWAERCTESTFSKNAVKYGVESEDGMKGIAEGWRRWVDEEDGWMMAPAGEVVARIHKYRIE